jgi:hypothetical protein
MLLAVHLGAVIAVLAAVPWRKVCSPIVPLGCFA